MAYQGRKWSVVIHDVPQEAKDLCHSVLKKTANKYLIALEPYPEGNQKQQSSTGFHLHLFYELKSPSPKDRQLKKWQAFNWGRVQCDPQLKNATDADRQVYLTNPQKDKEIDPDPIVFPNNRAGICQCKPGWYFQMLMDSYQRSVRDLENHRAKLRDTRNPIFDFEGYSAQAQYLAACCYRALDQLEPYRRCQKCGVVPAFFLQEKKSQ